MTMESAWLLFDRELTAASGVTFLLLIAKILRLGQNYNCWLLLFIRLVERPKNLA